MKSCTFSKRSGAATKGFESSGGIFQFKYSFVFSGIVCIEENNLKISLALFIRLEFSVVLVLCMRYRTDVQCHNNDVKLPIETLIHYL